MFYFLLPFEEGGGRLQCPPYSLEYINGQLLPGAILVNIIQVNTIDVLLQTGHYLLRHDHRQNRTQIPIRVLLPFSGQMFLANRNL